MADLVKSLEADPEMLAARPLIALPDGVVLSGNQRLLAAQKLGWESIPVITVDLGPERARLWCLRDNSSYGAWDEPALAELLAELNLEGVDLALTGFADRDLDRILAGLSGPAVPDEAAAAPVSPLSKPGEIYELGRHRLLCGDSTDPAGLVRLLGGEQVAALVTDLPWGVDYTGKTARALRIANDDPAGLPEFLTAAFAALDEVVGPSTPFYLFAPSGPAGTEFLLALRTIGWKHRQTIVWCKDAIVVGHSDYQNCHESILYGFTPGAGRVGRGCGRGWYGGNAEPSVLFFDRPKRSPDHPTSKPVGLVATLIRNSTRRGELVFDPFAGSGSTLLAAELTGRRCAAAELDRGYCDVIKTRYERLGRDG
jgi:site-specific DNA-methyltransferase (adenine-specific)